MKLAEALVIRSDLQSKIEDLASRLDSNAVVQDGENPAEDPKDLLRQLDRTLKELEQFMVKINLTNALACEDGKTMTELLAQRDCLKRRLSVMRSFLFRASNLSQRTRANEIVVKSTITVSELQKNVDKQSAELRKLELKIQALNWQLDLID